VASTDKLIMKQRLEAAKIPVARSRPLTDLAGVAEAAEDLGWPLVVKPRLGMGVVGTVRINSPAHLEELRRAGAFDQNTEVPAGWQATGLDRALEEVPGGLIAEQSISVIDEFSCDILRHEGGEVFILPARYPAPLLGASDIGAALLPSDHDQAAQVVTMARAAADALRLRTGFAHVEVLLDSHGAWRVGEIALRPGGSRIPDLLRLQHGVDVHALQADLAMRRVPLVVLRPETEPIAWIGVHATAGLVTAITPTSEILRRPGVIAAEAAFEVGDYSTGPLGSAVAAAHVFAQAPTVARAEDLALRAAAAWQVTTLPPPVHSAAQHTALA
jgi:biotin carboxylase